jgi:HEAT repeat protein
MDWLTSRSSSVDRIQHDLLSASGFKTLSAVDRITAATVAFQQLGPAAESVLPDLLTLMDDPIRVHAAVLAVHGVGLNDTSDASPLIRACTNGYYVTEIHAMTALGALGNRATNALPVLTNRFFGTGYDVRAAAAVACARIRGPASTIVPLIIGSLQNSNRWSQGLLEPAHCDRMHLWALGEYGMQASNALPVISNYLNHFDARVQAAARDAMAKIQAEQAD